MQIFRTAERYSMFRVEMRRKRFSCAVEGNVRDDIDVVNRFRHDVSLGEGTMIFWATPRHPIPATSAGRASFPNGTINEECCCVDSVGRNRKPQTSVRDAAATWIEVCKAGKGTVAGDRTHAWSRGAVECTGDTVDH